MKKSLPIIVRQLLARLVFGGVSPPRLRRQQLASRWLTGYGIEIGALYNPLAVSATSKVTYVDRMDVEGLRRHYPELSKESLIPVDIIDDGEFLTKFSDESQDFIIANHFLEHCENPIGAVATWLRVLRSDGIAYVAVPDKRFTFDYARPATTWQHVLRDWRKGFLWSREEHYREWAKLVENTPPREINARVQTLMKIGYSIHFHVWTSQTLQEFFHRCNTELSFPFTICEFVRNEREIIVVLKKVEEPYV
jgi:predicted SAM-dependent methyltransferase